MTPIIALLVLMLGVSFITLAVLLAIFGVAVKIHRQIAEFVAWVKEDGNETDNY